MLRIIDRTLSAMDRVLVEASEETLFEMCQLIGKTGVHFIELSVPVMQKMAKLPEGISYILKINHLEEKERYPGFAHYVYNARDIETLIRSPRQDAVIYEIKVDHMPEEVQHSEKKGQEISRQLRVTGLDQMMFTDYKQELLQLKQSFKRQMDFCPKDGHYCATALVMEWLLNGGQHVSVSFNGVGGYAKLEEVMMSIQVIMHKKVTMDLSVLPRLTQLYEMVAHTHIHYNKAVIGKNIFNLEAGVQGEKSKRNELTYEPYDPALVGKSRRLVIGKYSGLQAVKLKLQEKGIQVEDEAALFLLEVIKVKSMDKRRSLTDREFLRLANEVRCREA